MPGALVGPGGGFVGPGGGLVGPSATYGGVVVMAPMAVVGTGVVGVSGVGVLTMPLLVVHGSGSVPIEGVGVLTMPLLAVVGSGTVGVVASGAALTLELLRVVGTGTVLSPSETLGPFQVVPDVGITATGLPAPDPDTSTAGLLGGEGVLYALYLRGGGRLVLLGENPTAGAVHNPCLISFVAALGGGTIGAVAHTEAPETVLAPFTGPTPVSSVQFQAPGLAASPGGGSFITTSAGGGAAILFTPGTVGSAPAGTLIVMFDVTLLDPANAGENELAKNIIAYQSGGPLSTALIVANPEEAYEIGALATNLTALLALAGYTVTVALATPANLSAYGQVWDIRYTDACPVDPSFPPSFLPPTVDMCVPVTLGTGLR